MEHAGLLRASDPTVPGEEGDEDPALALGLEEEDAPGLPDDEGEEIVLVPDADGEVELERLGLEDDDGLAPEVDADEVRGLPAPPAPPAPP